MTSLGLYSELRSRAFRLVSRKLLFVLLSIALAPPIAVSTNNRKPSGSVPSGFLVSTVRLKPPFSRWVSSRKKRCCSLTREECTVFGLGGTSLLSRSANEKGRESAEGPVSSKRKGRVEAPGVKRVAESDPIRKGRRRHFSGQAFFGKNRRSEETGVQRRHDLTRGRKVEDTQIMKNARYKKGRSSSKAESEMKSNREGAKGVDRRRSMSADDQILRGYTRKITETGRHGSWKDALSLFEELKSKGLRPNVFIFSALLTCLARAPGGSRWEKALEVFGEMERRGVKPDTVTFNVLISAMEKAPGGSQWEKALEVFGEMERRGVEPDTVIFNALISAMENAPGGSQWEKALEVFGEMERRGVKPDTVTFSALISAMEKAPGGSQWEKALEVFGGMKRRGVESDTVTFSALISAMEKAPGGSQWEKALEVFGEMERRGVEPDTVTFNALISAMEKAPGGSQWEKALEVFGGMKRRGVEPNTVTFNALISAMEEAPGGSQWEKALEVFGGWSVEESSLIQLLSTH
uniref:Pentacotripeptide-repeat region of PRORP domain-containing protein n=1 Tax=Chromera velia CCMP2878 TaxID=1169474 RepID=A0A0G4HYV0_9ALVE|eukprot:Cvel_33712.t1-p1 / transcript=Cvel_33712.t1 / gene=Cvel_33712 / organism=Chromera_velia_CCMP2878 / gene_product=Pentatricopeptide repeat-containing protein, putative / transcript_product=Pentatricopeptide repeat-containing protein, putative / location=Cvel_scaffold5556:2224-3786(-) / protein_length=521 / sequence_SO=supercontig / SO=protein_coding / is_pseudo=false